MTINERIKILLEKITNINNISFDNKDELFSLHNEIFEEKEYNKVCVGCIKRTHLKLRDYYLKNMLA